MDHDAAVARAQRLLDQVKTGKTVFFKAGAEWLIMGPAGDMEVGRRVTVTKASGETTDVLVRAIASERTVQGVSARTATFVPAPAETVIAQLARPLYPVVDRQATAVGGMLGRTVTTHGYCHYCGLELDRSGGCPECV